MRDPYNILGVDRSAPQKEIKSAFRKLAKKYHPDQNPDNPKAKERFAEANSAYEIVGDKKKRGQFDRGEIDGEGKEKFTGFPGGGGQPGSGDPFAGMRRQRGQANPFGGNAGGPEDILKEMFGSAFASAQTQQNSGFGGMHPGQGRAKAADINLKAIARIEDLARGKTQVMFPDGRKVSVSIPPEAKDGQVIRLKGQGETHPGAAPGDALITLVLRQGGKFEKRGNDLRVEAELPLSIAVTGGKITVDTLDGKLSLGVPAWTTSGKIFRVKGKGLPTKAKGMGDLLVRVIISLPKEKDADLAELFEKRK
ncbi:MAG: DnaJ domain-containing protein [Rhizobiaceae bacterium]|nr:DnaJ domain-containing protein [Rhizobiaceae bacterium]